MQPRPTTNTDHPAADGEVRPLPGRHAESPKAFYERITKRKDVRRLLQKLACH